MKISNKRLIELIKNPYLLKESILNFLYYKKKNNKKYPYLGYLYDYNFNKKGNSRYYNFWRNYENDFWLKDFVDYRKINRANKSISYISVFGPKQVLKYLNDKKIFFTGEDIGKDSINGLMEYNDYLLNDVNLSIGFREYDNKNYIRFPLRITQLVDPWMKCDDIKKRIEDINNRDSINKDKFCCLIARHDKNGERGKTYNQLKIIGNIDCPSSFNHNIDIDLPNYDDKRKFMEDYRFNICLENHSVKGYVTEKLIDSLMSKCIPIYNGILTDFDKSIINEEAIISTLDKDWIKKVEKIQSNEDEYKKFISIKPFKKEASFILGKHLDLLEKKLKIITNS